MKTAEVLYTTYSHKIEKRSMDEDEFTAAITEDRQSITNKIKEMIDSCYKEKIQRPEDIAVRDIREKLLTELQQWIEGGSE